MKVADFSAIILSQARGEAEDRALRGYASFYEN
jgi:hypothetical protein